jgi:hypothetical protein
MDFVNITPVISGIVFHHWVKKKFIGESRRTILKIAVQIRYCSIPLRIINIFNSLILQSDMILALFVEGY